MRVKKELKQTRAELDASRAHVAEKERQLGQKRSLIKAATVINDIQAAVLASAGGVYITPGVLTAQNDPVDGSTDVDLYTRYIPGSRSATFDFTLHGDPKTLHAIFVLLSKASN